MKRLALALAAPLSAAALTPKALARMLPSDRAQDLSASTAGATVLEVLILGIVLVVATTLVLAGRLGADGYQIMIRGARHFNFTDNGVFYAPFLKLRGELGAIAGRRFLAISRTYTADADFDPTS